MNHTIAIDLGDWVLHLTIYEVTAAKIGAAMIWFCIGSVIGHYACKRRPNG